MNEFLMELLILRNKLNHDGWIIIPPGDDQTLKIRVEWFDKEKYSYQKTFNYDELEIYGLAEMFIKKANQEIAIILLSQDEV